MNPIARETLKELLRRFGTGLCNDPKRCEGLLRDMCPDCKREAVVLANAAREGVAGELYAASSRDTVKAMSRQLSRRLQDNLWLAEDVAAWAVETWAFALGRSQDPS